MRTSFFYPGGGLPTTLAKFVDEARYPLLPSSPPLPRHSDGRRTKLRQPSTPLKASSPQKNSILSKPLAPPAAVPGAVSQTEANDTDHVGTHAGAVTVAVVVAVAVAAVAARSCGFPGAQALSPSSVLSRLNKPPGFVRTENTELSRPLHRTNERWSAEIHDLRTQSGHDLQPARLGHTTISRTEMVRLIPQIPLFEELLDIKEAGCMFAFDEFVSSASSPLGRYCEWQS